MVTPSEMVSFMYHDVTDEPSTSGFQRAAARSYTYTAHAFERHLEEIETGPLSPRLVSTLDPTRPGRHLLLTFDDGGRSAVDIADALSVRGWKGHFFVVTDRIGDRTFLDAAAIREIRRSGHHIGSHSHTHPDIFRDLPRARMLAEWRTSCGILSDILGEPCVSASVPGGDSSRTVFESAAEVGLRHLFTSEPWLHPRRVGDCWIFGRFIVKAGLSPHAVARLLEGRGWQRALFARRLKGIARRTLGPLYRLYVRRVTRADVPAPSAEPESTRSPTTRPMAGTRGGCP